MVKEGISIDAIKREKEMQKGLARQPDITAGKKAVERTTSKTKEVKGIKGYVNGKLAVCLRGRKSLTELGYSATEIKARRQKQVKEAVRRYRVRKSNNESIATKGRGAPKKYTPVERAMMGAVYSARARFNFPFTLYEYEDFKYLHRNEQIRWLAEHRKGKDIEQKGIIEKAMKVLGLE